MEDNHAQYRSLAEAKREADDYHPMVLSPELDRIARFFWWIVGGLLAGAIAVTIWVTNINSLMSSNTSRIIAIEAVEKAASIADTAQDRAEALQNTTIASIQKELDNRTPMIKEHQEMWFLKEHGISNKEDFMSKHGYPAPNALGEPPNPTPRK